MNGNYSNTGTLNETDGAYDTLNLFPEVPIFYSGPGVAAFYATGVTTRPKAVLDLPEDDPECVNRISAWYDSPGVQNLRRHHETRDKPANTIRRNIANIVDSLFGRN